MEPDASLAGEVPGSKRSLALALGFVLAAGAALLIPAIPHVLRVLLTLLHLGALGVYLSLRRSEGETDYLEVVLPFAVIHIFVFGISAIYLAYDPEAIRPSSVAPYITAASALGLVGFVSFLFGYAYFFNWVGVSRTSGLVPRGFLPCVVLGAMGLVGNAVGVEKVGKLLEGLGVGPAGPILLQMNPLFLFAWFLVWAMFWREPRRLLYRAQVAALLPMAALLLFLTLGRKETSITILAFPALAYGYSRRTFPVKSFVALILLLVFLIFPFYTVFRQQETSLDSVTRLGKSVDDAKRWDATAYYDHSVRAFFSRMAVINSVAAILKDTGRWVEFKKGETLMLGPIGFLIPRFVWPEKPSLNIGNEFGATFGILGDTDRETQVAPTMVGELYWNFHVPAVILGMILLGAAYRWYYRKYGMMAGFDPVRRSIYMALLPSAVHLEGNVAITIGGVVRALALFALVTFVFRRAGAFTDMAESAEGGS